MSAARYEVALANEPADLLERLRHVFAEQGSPPIEVTRASGSLVFRADTGDFMLRARAADALTTVCGDWQQRLRPDRSREP
jgi:hypothetical protein